MTGRELADWRTSHGLTQSELARWLGTHPITVSQWEIGRRRTPGRMLVLALEAIATRKARGEQPPEPG